MMDEAEAATPAIIPAVTEDATTPPPREWEKEESPAKAA
jgi:hypothetical protein